MSLHRGAFADEVAEPLETIDTPESDDYQDGYAIEEEYEFRPEPHREAVVDLSRKSFQEVHPLAKVEEESIAPRRRTQRRAPKAAGPAKVVQALLIAIAGLSLVIALIGSGLADHLLGTGNSQPRVESPVIDLIQGESEYK